MSSTGFDDVPPEIISKNIFGKLDLADQLNLRSTSRRMNDIFEAHLPLPAAPVSAFVVAAEASRAARTHLLRTHQIDLEATPASEIDTDDLTPTECADLYQAIGADRQMQACFDQLFSSKAAVPGSADAQALLSALPALPFQPQQQQRWERLTSLALEQAWERASPAVRAQLEALDPKWAQLPAGPKLGDGRLNVAALTRMLVSLGDSVALSRAHPPGSPELSAWFDDLMHGMNLTRVHRQLRCQAIAANPGRKISQVANQQNALMAQVLQATPPDRRADLLTAVDRDGGPWGRYPFDFQSLARDPGQAAILSRMLDQIPDVQVPDLLMYLYDQIQHLRTTVLLPADHAGMRAAVQALQAQVTRCPEQVQQAVNQRLERLAGHLTDAQG